MNYPVWELYFAGGGLLIATIAVVHVYVAHFAVGGGLFLVLTELKGYREDSKNILDYTKKHSKFFLLLTIVFGGITGVGIWFTISLLSPGATSTLIHTFVFGWATEWVCFMVEIVALFIYFYRFGKMDKKAHLTIGWLYFIFAWLSLFLINGIIDFMLTPGDWLNTNNFWDGFFNPTMWPALFFRTSLSFVLAGIFGFITAVFIKETIFRENMVRYCAKWLLFPFIFLLLFAYWYVMAVPEAQRAMILGRSPEIVPFVKIFTWILPVMFIGALLMAIRIPGSVKKPMAFALLIIGLIYMFSFEYIREAGRRPFLIYGHTYSNSILVKNEDKINEKGLLKIAKWVEYRDITDENILEAGKEIFKIECMSCHSTGGPLNDIFPLTKKYSVFGMDAQLNGMGKIIEYMPKFMGTRKERLALARYIVEGLHGKKESPIRIEEKDLYTEIPVFNEEKDEYVLLAWSSTGMHFFTDSDPLWNLIPPGNNLYAQLIRRGETPEIVTEDVVISYAVEKGFEKPSKHVKFWEYAEHYFGKRLPPDIGLSGNGLKGEMKLNEERMVFTADMVPVVPYSDDGSFNPYPLFTIEAIDKSNGKILVRTSVVAPTSTEMGCRNCHGGKWRVNDKAGLSRETSKDILAVHDRISKTNLLGLAEKGQPVLCQSCHPDQVFGAKGKPELLNLSAAIHGFHANYLTNREDEACNTCHPSSPKGNTQFLRGIHMELGLDCTSCHWKMEDHALSLLKAEKKAGKKKTDRLMKHLSPRSVSTIEQINPRTPWFNEPDCMNCHVDFEEPETDESEFNLWTKGVEQLYRMRTDDVGIMCEACHGSTHAIYPTKNLYDKDRDNIIPLQYQNNPYPVGANRNCKVCHTIDMEEEVHHPNSLAMFRNTF